jgi:histidyl-tRNA synthetase
MALSTQPYKGARDFYPEDKRIQNYLFTTMKTVVKRFGYQEYDAPILEPVDLYKAKSGQEIVDEQTYNFTDRGGREVAIRPEMTPTVSRMVASRRQELAYPARWFSIPNLWRYERPQRGRLREHWQLNVDIFGESGVAADHELIQVADSILKEFGAKPSMYSIKINSRKLINDVMSGYLRLDDQQAHALIKLIDRMHKMSDEAFRTSLDEICVGMLDDVPSTIIQLLNAKSVDELPDEVQANESLGPIKQLLELLADTGITNAVFDMTLMRGFDYYTDIVFEIHDTHPENNRSMFGGGRYNGLVGLFGVDPVPTAGFGMGDVTLAQFLNDHNLMPQIKTETEVLMIVIGDVYPQASKLAMQMREADVSVAIDASSRKIDKKLKSADKQGIRYILFVGENELNEQQYPLKDMVTSQEEKHSIERIITIVEDYRR